MKKYFIIFALVLLVTSCSPVVVISFNAMIGLSIIVTIALFFVLYLAYLWVIDQLRAFKKFLKKHFSRGKKSN